MRSSLWPAGTICGDCVVRYSGLRSGENKQGSREGHEKKDSGTHARILVAIAPGAANDSVASTSFACRMANGSRNPKRQSGKCSRHLLLTGDSAQIPSACDYFTSIRSDDECNGDVKTAIASGRNIALGSTATKQKATATTRPSIRPEMKL